MDLHLHGKTALVAASSKGLGKTVAAALAEEGCRVMLTGRDPAALRATASELREQTGGTFACHPCDITRADDIRHLMQVTQAELGRVDGELEVKLDAAEREALESEPRVPRGPAGLVDEVRGQITIRDRAQLAAACCECYRLMRDEQRRLLGY